VASLKPRTLACLLAAAAIAALAFPACGSDDGNAPRDDPASRGFDAARAMRDLRAQVAIGPRPAGSDASRRLVRLLAARLDDAGVRDVRVQRPHRNVVGVVPGRRPGFVVLGAHHDTYDVAEFVGANDGASGVAVVLELVRSLPRPLPGPSIAVALFDAEEARPGRLFTADGLRGSNQYVRYARAGRKGSVALEEIRAMILFDMVGDCDLALPRERTSDPGLYAPFATADPDLFTGEATPVVDDHIPFALAGIPAVDLIDFSYGPGPRPGAWWHTTEDNLAKVCSSSLDAVGEAALAALPTIR
jgi:glutaminyl-peptide cyclotransferase